MFDLKIKRCIQSQNLDTTSNECGKTKVNFLDFLMQNKININQINLNKKAKKKIDGMRCYDMEGECDSLIF